MSKLRIISVKFQVLKVRNNIFANYSINYFLIEGDEYQQKAIIEYERKSQFADVFIFNRY